MKNLRLLFVVGLAAGFIAATINVSAQTSVFGADDLYLEGRSSGNFPLDDEDGEDDGSGSGSGDYVSQHLTTTAKNTVPERKDSEERTSPSSAPPFESTSLSTGIKEANEDNSLDRWERPTPTDIEDQHEIIENEIVPNTGRGSGRYGNRRAEGVTSENLWERTEVLAAVIACGVVGFLCAVSLLLFLAYRMKKKDEGSYDLGDNKLSNAQYHKAPTKEFYA
uniref:Syndecan n=1 Tax=Tetraodon nigroviridis TaxID=99883 RepID=H3BXC2_TETNG